MDKQARIDELNQKALDSIKSIIEESGSLTPQNKIATIGYLISRAKDYTDGELMRMDIATSW